MMAQLSLDIPPRVRRTDPETSVAAASDAKKFAGKHYRKILRFLQRIAPQAAHYVAIAEGTGLEKHQVGRRLAELRDAGYILVMGTRPLPNSTRKATAYRITGKGCEMLNERAA